MRAMSMSHALIASLVLSGGCDRKTEPPAPAADEPKVAVSPVVEKATVGVIEVIDAGADAAPAVVGTSITAVVVHGHPQVVDGIANARCQREKRCKNIGKDKKFASLDACRSQIREDWRGELNAYECPGGVDAKELAECLREVQNENCKNPFDTLERVIACRSSDLCLSTR
ncbi:MAG TPA: DUF6184 family natural product biosynthesis lipoprotein [Polyangiales bacterium]|nr:DUF6184 family natural product biosynthesis lipoprotein [Polyangiales bacterium]